MCVMFASESIDVNAIIQITDRPLHTARASRRIIYLSVLTLLLRSLLSVPGDLRGGSHFLLDLTCSLGGVMYGVAQEQAATQKKRQLSR